MFYKRKSSQLVAVTSESSKTIVLKIEKQISGGGSSISLQSKTATPTTSQQTITADSGYDGLSSVTVNAIPSSYVQPSGTINITGNGTFDVTNYASAIVASSSWTKLGETNITASTTSNSASSAGQLTVSGAWTSSQIIYVRIRDTVGAREGYFIGSDNFFVNYNAANGSTSAFTNAIRYAYRYATGRSYAAYASTSTTGYGVYAYDINTSGRVQIYKRYNSNYSSRIDGTYHVEVYALKYPDNASPFVAPSNI